jgi:uncharacterized protein (TIGR02679 family)
LNDRVGDRLRSEDYARLWQRSLAAVERNGLRPEGTVSLPRPSDAERTAIGALLGRHRRPAASMRVDLAAVDAALQASPLASGLLAWLEAEHGPLRDRRAEAAADREWDEAVWEVALDHPLAQEAWYAAWIDGLRADGLLKRLAPGREDELLADACAVLSRLPVDRVSLAVLASEVTGDTKRLTDTALAGVVLRGLAAWEAVDRPASAAQRRALWARFGVVEDDLSSHVLVLNLRADGLDALASWLSEAAGFGEPFRVTLRQLVNTTPGDCVFRTDRPQGSPVYVCENPAVVLEAANRLGEDSAPLVCTEGRRSEACDVLLRRLAADGCELRARGDFDWPGVQMAGALIDLGAAPWRFSADDYVSACEQSGDRSEPLAGKPVATPWDAALSDEMSRQGRRIFEEQMIEHLLADLDLTSGA